MNFYVVFCKSKRKFDKYIKVNRCRNKVIIDILDLIKEYDIELPKHTDYFNLMIFTKINNAITKGKDIYYLPDINNGDLKIDELFKIKEIFNFPINFNVLIYYDEFKNDKEILDEIMSNIPNFYASQIIKDY